MTAVLTVVQTAVPVSGLPLALTIACAVTALVAVGMIVAQLRRTSRLTPIAGGLGATSAAGIVAIAIIVGVAVSGAASPTHAVNSDTSLVSTVSTHTADPYDVQLPTLSLNN